MSVIGMLHAYLLRSEDSFSELEYYESKKLDAL